MPVQGQPRRTLQGDTFSISPVFLDQSHENEKASSR
eukprot:SAG31_NODE_7362_length_1710_cov_0.968963_3_plen_35_part_01